MTNISGNGRQTELDGNWVGRELEASKRTGDWTFVFSGNDVRVNGPDFAEWCKGTFSTNADTNPRQMDLVVKECHLREYVGCTVLAIYQIEEDTLTWAGNEPGAPVRPTDLVPSKGTRVFALVKQ